MGGDRWQHSKLRQNSTKPTIESLLDPFDNYKALVHVALVHVARRSVGIGWG
jgi:hypothetical protein